MSLAQALAEAEQRLRAGGLAGARAFDALIDGLRARLGDDVPVHPLAAEVLRDVALSGDLLDLAWERFFPDVFKASHGQYFTPPPVARLVVALARIRPGDDVLDPTCGGGGLLRAALGYGARVRGVERDPGLASLARVQLRLAGAPPRIDAADWFTWEGPPADVVVANPPFSIRVDGVASEDVFVRRLGSAVRAGGRASVVLPWSIVHNRRKRAIRGALEADFAITDLVELPEGVFRPFGGAAGRAVALGLARRPCAAVAARRASVVDPGYDVRTVHLRATDSAEIARLIAGEGWLTPEGDAEGERVTVASIAVAVGATRAREPAPTVDLADVDRATGEVVPRPAGATRRRRLAAGEVWVSRLRPDLGAIGWAPYLAGPLAGSPEWIALDAGDAAGWLASALRSPTWRASLPATTGQTHPRTSPADVLASRLRPPGRLGARWTAVTGGILAERARLRARLDHLQLAMDAYQAGEIDLAALETALDAAG